jgi:periplasmic protein TonB
MRSPAGGAGLSPGRSRAMFTRLVASARHRSQFRRPTVILGSIAVHAALLAGIIWASTPDTSQQASAIAPDEEVTYIDIAEIPEPEMVFEEPAPAAAPPAAVLTAPPAVPRTRPAQPRQAPAATPAPATPSQPAGFQELRAPPTVLGVAPPDPTVPPVRAEDFGGRGAAGGSAGGTAPPEAGSGRIGTGSTAGAPAGTGTTGGTGTGPPTGTFSANLVDRQASLRNQDEVVRLMQRLYPSGLRAANTEGSVQVQFVVTAEGRVDMSTVQVVSSTNAEFAEATLKALQQFRFTPARKGEHNVRMLTALPIRWKLER